MDECKVLINSLNDLIFYAIEELNEPELYWSSFYKRQSNIWYLHIWKKNTKTEDSQVVYTVMCRTHPFTPGFEVHKQGSNMRPESAFFKNFGIPETAKFVINKLRINLYRRRQKLRATQ